MIRDLTEALAVAITFIGIFMLAWALTGWDDEPEPVSYVTFDPVNEVYPQCPVGNIVMYDPDGTWFCVESSEYWEYDDNWMHRPPRECYPGEALVDLEDGYTFCMETAEIEAYRQRFLAGEEEYCPDYRVDWEPCNDDDEDVSDY